MTTSATGASPAIPDGKTVPDHRGSNEHIPFHFFALSPSEIGLLQSAESTVRQGKSPKPLGMRLAISLASAAPFLLLFFWLASSNPNRSDASALRTFGCTLAVVAFLIAFFLTRFRARCSYIGKGGVSRAFVKRSLENPPRTDMLLFAQAAELHASQTRHFVNGVYTGTTYDYYWNDVNGARLYRLKGKYHGKNKPPKNGDPFHFVKAAEVAWSQHFLDRADQHLKAEGSIPFRVDRKRWVRVGPGFMEFHFGGDPVRVTREEIAKVTLGSGQFAFKHKDAKWLSREGKYNFRYGTMANGMVFLLALDKLMGYRWN